MNPKLSTVQVARAVHVPQATLQRWIKTGKIAAPAIQVVNGRAVRLWTAAEVRLIRKLKGSLKPGPKGPRKSPS
jgi:predicted site-specific integrase-resolvase